MSQYGPLSIVGTNSEPMHLSPLSSGVLGHLEPWSPSLEPWREPTQAEWDAFYFSPALRLRTVHRQAGHVVGIVLCGEEFWNVQVADHGRPVGSSDGAERNFFSATISSPVLFGNADLVKATIKAIHSRDPALVGDHVQWAWWRAVNQAFVWGAGVAGEAFHAEEDCGALLDCVFDFPEDWVQWAGAMSALEAFIPDLQERMDMLFQIWSRTEDYLSSRHCRSAIEAVAVGILERVPDEQLERIARSELGSAPWLPIQYPILRRWRALTRLPQSAEALLQVC
jgi:hypothetical protein